MFAKDPYESIIDFIDAVIDSDQITSWLSALESLTQNTRTIHLAETKIKMENDGAPKEHIEIIQFMQNEKILRAMNSVIRDVHASGMRTKKFISKTNNTNYKTLISLIAR